MFNLFKSSPKVTVQDIHNEFNSCGETLLKEANELLQIQTSDKAERLERAGFKVAKGVKENAEIKAKKAEAQLRANMIQRYAMSYPNQKFITEDAVKRICDKYGLVCAPIDRYKGFVPDEKLKQIEAFKCIFNIDIPSQKYFILDNGIESNETFSKVRGRLVDHDEVRRLGIHLNYCKHIEIGWNIRMICAPKKDFDLSGLTALGSSYLSGVTHVPDPVVLQPIKGGYLILAAWGDEASDPEVVNERMN